MAEFSLDSYQQLLQPITDFIAAAPLDKNLQDQLNAQFPANGEAFNAIVAASHAGIATKALCKHEAPGIKYGRVIKPSPALNGYSVDVVKMDSVVGPHHRHPNGEIDLIMPISPAAKFDDHGAGWLVYGPDSAHCPTVTDGESIVLYLLPSGEIEFTRQ
ncbi:4-hydroxylaminobenzoate lyase [Ketobacter sp.]|mgnify:CR=1 FL=1|nr:MAG: DUF4863 family protein [Ketobacter sp.]